MSEEKMYTKEEYDGHGHRALMFAYAYMLEKPASLIGPYGTDNRSITALNNDWVRMLKTYTKGE